MPLTRSHFFPLGVRQKIKNIKQGIPIPANTNNAPIIYFSFFLFVNTNPDATEFSFHIE
jgi:hypothetical protein